MRFFAIAIVLALAAPASAEDWSKYIDHGEPVPGVNKNGKAAEDKQAKANEAKQAKEAKAAAKAPKATAAKPQAKARAKPKARRK